MSTSFVGDITHIPFMNASTTGMCVLQTTDEVDIGGHYNSTLEQGQCFVLTLLTLPQTAPERMSNVGHSRAAIGQSEGRCPLTCTGHPPCRTPPKARRPHPAAMDEQAIERVLLHTVPQLCHANTGQCHFHHREACNTAIRTQAVIINSDIAVCCSYGGQRIDERLHGISSGW